MKVISIVNEKGGVGKTALATHLSAALSIQGNRVLLIDTDAQGHSSIAFGMKKSGGLYDLLAREAAWKDVIKVVPPAQYYEGDLQSSKGSLFLLPDDIQTRAIGDLVEDVFMLYNRLQEVKPIFDYVILDTAPSPSKLQVMLFVATDILVIPTKLEYWGFDGVARSVQGKQSFDKFRLSKGLPETILAGITPMMYKSQTVEHSENLLMLQQQFPGKVFSPIHDRVIWSEAAHFSKSLFALQPESKAAKDAWRFSQEFMEAIHAVQA